MEKLYIGLVDTPGIFAWMIRRFIGQNYIHVVLSLDEGLEECYSIGRRFPAIPFFAGFEREEKRKIARVFPQARYLVYSISCTKEQKQSIGQTLERCYQHRYKYHYCIIGLFYILINKEFYQKNHYTCSSFIAKLLDRNGISLFDKHFSLVTPKDFYELEEKEILYEGKLTNMLEKDNMDPAFDY